MASVYQYFPDKQAIFAALHDRHVDAMAQLVERTFVAHAESPLEELVRALVERLIDAHGEDPCLHEVLAGLPQTTTPFQLRLRNAFRLALATRHDSPDRLERILFVVPAMVDALAHAQRPTKLSLAAAKREAVRAVLAYLTVA